MSSSPSHQPIHVPPSPNITTTPPQSQQPQDHEHVATHKTIGMLGGVALLINNVTGGGLVLFPGLFHEAGWLPMTASIIGVALLSSLCGLMLLESMAMMPNNGNFQKRIEYCNIAEYYMSRRVYVITGILYQASLLTAIISMIIQSVQVVDFTIVAFTGRSCAVPAFTPNISFHCPDPVKDDITPFGPIYLISLGFWLTALIVIPLSLADLDDNVLVQKGALISMVIILFTWIGMFIHQGLDTSRVPMFGTSQDSVLGVVVFNFAIITSLPSWVNEKQERVSVLKTIAIAFPASSLIYLVIGALGGMAFPPWYASDNPNQTLLDQIYELDTRIARLTFYLFPVCVNLTSIPVFCIMSRYNLIESGVCTRRTANLIAVFAPWIISIPLYTGSGYENLINWSGIVINSYVNFVVPPIIYILAIRRTSPSSHSSSHPITSTSTLQTLLTEADDRHIIIPDKLKKTIHVKNIMSAPQDVDVPQTPWKCYDTSCFGMIWYIITLPWRLFFYITIPDTRRSTQSSTYILIFTTIMITCWMSLLTWHIIWMSTEISDILRIPTMILGMIVLATGVRLPSLWRSVMWARTGDMKTPISLSHHVFDLCIGIGVPVILFGAIHGTPFSHFSSTTPIITLTTFLLIGSTLILLQGWTTWQFQPRLIIWLIPSYVALMLWMILIIQGTFGDVTGGLLVKPC